MNLTLEESLDQEIHDKGIAIERRNIRQYGLDGLYYASPDIRRPVITIDSGITDTPKLNVVKAHELGNNEYAVCNMFEAPAWISNKHRALALRWQVRRYMPLEKLIRGFYLGHTKPWSMAEFLEIPDNAFYEGLELYSRIYGPVCRHGQHILTWRPFYVGRACI